MTDEDLSSASARLIVRAITSGVLNPKKDVSEIADPEKTGSTSQDHSDCATFKKSDLSFHACQLLDKDCNPSKKNLYLVCVTAVDAKIKAEKEQRKMSPRTDEEEGDPVEEAEEEAKLKFFDFQQALKADMSRQGALDTKSLGNCLTKMI